MKKLTFIFSLFFPLLLYSQPRQNNSRIIQPSKSSPIINTIIGWCYNNEYKKWYGYHYTICSKPNRKGNNASYMTIEHLGADERDILSMQFKKFTYKDKDYYLLYINSWDSWFDYPHIYVGRHDYKFYSVFLFTQEDYNKIWESSAGIQNISICLLGTYGHRLKQYDTERNLLLNVFDETFEEKTENKNYVFFIKKEDKDTYRFQYPEHKYSRYTIDFNSAYYEEKAINFSKLRL